MGLFGETSDEKKAKAAHAIVERIVAAVHTQIGLQMAPLPPQVETILQQLTLRDLALFENVTSAAGLQELFRAHSLRAIIDDETQTITLSTGAAQDIAIEIQATHSQKKVIQMGERRPTAQIIPSPGSSAPIGAAAVASHSQSIAGPSLAPAATPPPPLPPGLENLDPLERLVLQVVDVLVRHGNLTIGDKEVLKKIKPTDLLPATRLTALERWQMEITRRVRGFIPPRTVQPLTLVGAEPASPDLTKPEDILIRRLNTLIVWTGKFIKAFELTGVRYVNKPVWLPH